MTHPFPLRAVAGCVALTAFSVAIISGLAGGRRTDLILQNALMFLLVGQIAGYFLAIIVKIAVGESLAEYQRSHPLSVSSASEAELHQQSPIDEQS